MDGPTHEHRLLTDIRPWLEPLAALISAIAAVLTLIPNNWRVLSFALILWLAFLFVFLRRDAPRIEGGKGTHLYSDGARQLALVGMVGIPFVLLGSIFHHSGLALVPLATWTPKPSITPHATFTLQPTYTPLATHTPYPTYTPQLTPTPYVDCDLCMPTATSAPMVAFGFEDSTTQGWRPWDLEPQTIVGLDITDEASYQGQYALRAHLENLTAYAAATLYIPGITPTELFVARLKLPENVPSSVLLWAKLAVQLPEPPDPLESDLITISSADWSTIRWDTRPYSLSTGSAMWAEILIGPLAESYTGPVLIDQIEIR